MITVYGLDMGGVVVGGLDVVVADVVETVGVDTGGVVAGFVDVVGRGVVETGAVEVAIVEVGGGVVEVSEVLGEQPDAAITTRDRIMLETRTFRQPAIACLL